MPWVSDSLNEEVSQMGFEEFLKFVQTSPGINFLIGVVWVYLIEFIPRLKEWFDGLATEMQRLVLGLFSLVAPLIALVLKIAFGFEILTIGVIWAVIVAWAVAFFGSHFARAVNWVAKALLRKLVG